MEFSAADATAISHATLQSDVAIAVAKKSLDHQKQQGAAALSLLDAASQVSTQPYHPNKGKLLDVTA